MAWRDPLGLDRYLWLLMLNRHDVDYQHIFAQLNGQLRRSQSQVDRHAPRLQAGAPGAQLTTT